MLTILAYYRRLAGFSRVPGRARPTGPRSRGDLATVRAVEDAVDARSAPAVRRRRGIGLVRRGRDRVRGGAASNELQRVKRRTRCRGVGPQLLLGHGGGA